MQENRPALLVMDVQESIMKNHGLTAKDLHPIKTALLAARAAAIPIIFVRVAFRDGYTEINPRNKQFAAISAQGALLDSDPASHIHPDVAPLPGEPIALKRRMSAFTGSDLGVLLSGYAINRLVLTGISTSGVVLSTFREALDKDYALTVLSDACLDASSEAHQALMNIIFPRHANILTAKEWAAEQER